MESLGVLNSLCLRRGETIRSTAYLHEPATRLVVDVMSVVVAGGSDGYRAVGHV